MIIDLNILPKTNYIYISILIMNKIFYLLILVNIL